MVSVAEAASAQAQLDLSATLKLTQPLLTAPAEMLGRSETLGVVDA